MSFIQFPNPTPIFPVLPPLTWSVHKKPIMSSRSTLAISSRSTQFATAAYPRWAFILSYGGSNSWLRERTQNITVDPTLSAFTELEQLSGLYFACIGPYGEFYYSDPDDNSRLAQKVGQGNGSQVTFPLSITWGTGPFTIPMTMPVGGIQSIQAVYFNGTVQSSGIYTLAANKTSITFSSAPAANVVITADFTFYFRCRFLDENMDYNQFARNKWEVKEVRFESVKP